MFAVRRRRLQWHRYTDHIQEAFLDLAYNLGPAGLMARKGDWEAAAALSNRRQVGDERNREIAGLLGQKMDA